MNHATILRCMIWMACAGCLIPMTLSAQVLINEVCSKNTRVLADATGEYPDWIELHNAGSETVNLSGYYLSDDDDNLKKWSFPSSSIAPGGFLIVFASERPFELTDIHTNFGLDSEGEDIYLSDPSGDVLDHLTVPPLQGDHTFGRYLEGANPFFFDAPTPLASNTSTPYPGYASQPVINETEALFAAPIRVAVSSAPIETVHYTLDGSIPTEESPLCPSILSIDATVIIRARAFATGFLPSPTLTQSFFINEHTALPILSMVADPNGLFDPDTGSYVLGPNADSVHPYIGANFWQDWERPMHMEMYYPNGEQAFSEDLGYKMHGGAQARTRAARSFRVMAKKKFGASNIEGPLFSHKNIDVFDRLVLRNSGGDFNSSHIRDGFASEWLIKEGLHIDLMSYRPCQLFLNGAYWGVYNLRERTDEDFVYSNYPELRGTEIDLLEIDFILKNGDSLYLYNVWETITTTDLSDESNFDYARKEVDLENVADYFIAETYLNNLDWPKHNLRFWRPQTDDGKWRYMMFDLDVAMAAEKWSNAEVNHLGNVFEMAELDVTHALFLSSLLENENYRNYFVNRYADLINTTFKPERFLGELNAVQALLNPEMPEQFDRWPLFERNMDSWHEEIDNLRQFITDRPDYARLYVQEEFELENQVELELNVSPPGAGVIRINTIEPEELPWRGTYFNGVPVTLTIIPAAGYEFKEWKSFVSIESNLGKSITVNFRTDDFITAFFEEENADMNVSVFPNPGEGPCTVEFVLGDMAEVTLNITNLNAELVYSANLGFYNAGLQRKQLPVLENGVYIVHIHTEQAKGTAKLIQINGDQ